MFHKIIERFNFISQNEEFSNHYSLNSKAKLNTSPNPKHKLKLNPNTNPNNTPSSLWVVEFRKKQEQQYWGPTRTTLPFMSQLYCSWRHGFFDSLNTNHIPDPHDILGLCRGLHCHRLHRLKGVHLPLVAPCPDACAMPFGLPVSLKL